jgi:peptidoglycan/LPS O-acetylase OafA/YrhL
MGYFDGWRLFGTGGLNALFIPSYLTPYHVYDEIFPYNGAQWSLTFELLANWLYWLLFPYLTKRRLFFLIGLAVATEIVVTMLLGSLDVGMRPSDFWLGIPRVILPFFTGVALRRYIFERVSLQLGGFGILMSALVLLATFSLSSFVPSTSVPAVELASVAILFPLLLVIVCRTMPSKRIANFCELTGNASYPVYLLQVSFFGLFAALPQIALHMKAHDFVPYVGIAHVVCTFVCAVWVDRYYELPVRNWLKRVWASSRQKRAASAITAA